MPLEIPQIDSRSYRELLDEALARIPVHNPEYTNFNDADPGITLLQLFAFMGESVIYRVNQIPERNRRAFLRLLGVPLRAAEPARGLVAFDNPRGPLAVTELDADEELLAAQVPFRTTHALEVLPVAGRPYFKSRVAEERRDELDALYRRLYASHEVDGASLEYYETQAFEEPRAGAAPTSLDLSADTVDGSLWMALLARPGEDPEDARQVIAGRVLSLGIVPEVDGRGKVLTPGGGDADAVANLVVEVPDTDDDDRPRYRRLEVRTDQDLLRTPGVAEVVLPAADELRTWDDLEPLEAGVGDFPPSLEDSEEGERLVTWLRVRVPRAQNGAPSSQVRARLAWAGLHAGEVVQQARVAAEVLPRGTGEPGQRANLVNTPVLLDSVRLTVDGEEWQPIDDLMAATAEVPAAADAADGRTPTSPKVFQIDRESGEIRFGDGAHGARPPAGASLQASYAYGGGTQGMIGIGAITKGPALAAGVKVSNPVATWGGDEAETVADAEQRIPRFLRHRDRLISTEDYLDVVHGTPGIDLGRVEVLPLFHPELQEGAAPGVVTILVLPRRDAARPDAPRPDQLFLETLCRHLEPRRLLTTELHIRGPEYRDVWISLGVEIVPGREQGPVLRAVEREARRFLSPLTGGFEDTGWPLRKAVDRLEIAAAATRVSGVSKVGEVLLGDPAGRTVETVPMSGLELPRIAGLSVAVGDAELLDQLRGVTGDGNGNDDGNGGDGGDGDGGGATRVPVPVVPEEC